MNTEEIRALLVARAEGVDSTRPERTDEVFDRIRTHQRRRTTAAVAGASFVVLALVVAGAVLQGQASRNSDPAPPANSGPADPNPVRKVTYTDEYWPTRHIQYGDRTVDISDQVPELSGNRPGTVHLDVTDDGVVFTEEDGGIWFTDGSSTHQIGETEGYLGIGASAVVVTGTAGSRVAWVTTSSGPGHEAIVVYDTGAGRELVRVPAPACGDAHSLCVAGINAFVGDDHVYWTRRERRGDVQMRLVVSTGRHERVADGALDADLASAPRGIIVGESLETGVVSNGYGQMFVVNGRRLIPVREGRANGDPATFPTTAFDTGTGQQLRFRMPAGDKGSVGQFTAFEWLDDDRLVLMNDANSWEQATAKILVCRISTGRCVLAAGAKPPGDSPRVAPHPSLPG